MCSAEPEGVAAGVGEQEPMRVLTQQSVGGGIREGAGVGGEFGSGVGVGAAEAVDVDDHQRQGVVAAGPHHRHICAGAGAGAGAGVGGVGASVGDGGEVGESISEVLGPGGCRCWSAGRVGVSAPAGVGVAAQDFFDVGGGEGVEFGPEHRHAVVVDAPGRFAGPALAFVLAGQIAAVLAGFPAAQFFSTIDNLFNQTKLQPVETGRENGATATN